MEIGPGHREPVYHAKECALNAGGPKATQGFKIRKKQNLCLKSSLYLVEDLGCSALLRVDKLVVEEQGLEKTLGWPAADWVFGVVAN